MNQERFTVLKVILDRKTNRVGVEGPTDDKHFCIRLLATGIMAITNIKSEESKIIKPFFIPPRDVGKP